MAELTMFKRTHVDLLLVRTELSLGVEEEKHGVGRNTDRYDSLLVFLTFIWTVAL